MKVEMWLDENYVIGSQIKDITPVEHLILSTAVQQYADSPYGNVIDRHVAKKMAEQLKNPDMKGEEDD